MTMKIKNIDKEIIERMIKMYETQSTLEIAKELKMHKSTIRTILIQNGVKIRNRFDSKLGYNANKNFFKDRENWTQKQSYFLGWLLSDGNITKNFSGLRIRLQERDGRILEILKDIIGYSGPLLYEKRNTIGDLIKKNSCSVQNRWGLCISNTEMVRELQSLGIPQNKTNRLPFPDYIKKDLIHHFLRGFYEGDGTISYSSTGKNNLTFDIHLIATEEFGKEVTKILKEKLNIDAKTYSKGHACNNMQNGNVRIVFTGIYNGLKFFNYIYKDADYVLKRKFRKFLRIINYAKRVKRWSRHLPIELVKEEANTAMQIAKQIIQTAQY